MKYHAIQVPIADLQRAEKPTNSGSQPRSALSAILVFLLLFAYAAWLQHQNGSFHAELSGESDEAAHFVTGLMVHDYVAKGFPGKPFAFAQQFYLHYPKVAIGHWPPVTYVLLTAWMLFFPATIQSAIFFIVVMATLLAYTLYHLVWRDFGSRFVAILAGLLLLSLPLLERFAGLLMADTPLALFVVWASIVWGRYLDSGKAGDAIRFAILASLAMLTKGNGFLLVLVPPATLVLGNRWRVMRKSSFWLIIGLTAILCIPWTLLTMKLVTPTFQYQPGLRFAFRAFSFYLSRLESSGGPLIISLALLGILVRFVPAWRAARPNGLWLSMLSLLLADIVFHSLVPGGYEERYLMSGEVPLLLFAVAGADWLIHLRIFSGLPLRSRVAAAAILVIAAFGFFNFHIARKYSFGLSEASADILTDPSLKDAALLCSSNRDGEGILISEVAMREPRNGHYVLRASKMLGDSDWNGQNYHSRFASAYEMGRFVDSLGVNVVVLDETPGVLHYVHNDLLRQAMQGSQWRLAKIYPRSQEGIAPGARVEVYRRIAASKRFDPSTLTFRNLVRSLE